METLGERWEFFHSSHRLFIRRTFSCPLINLLSRRIPPPQFSPRPFPRCHSGPVCLFSSQPLFVRGATTRYFLTFLHVFLISWHFVYDFVLFTDAIFSLISTNFLFCGGAQTGKIGTTFRTFMIPQLLLFHLVHEYLQLPSTKTVYQNIPAEKKQAVFVFEKSTYFVRELISLPTFCYFHVK